MKSTRSTAARARLALLVISSAAIAVFGASQAGAQTSTATAEADDVAEIVVSGSRIARPEIDSPIPVVTYSADVIAQSGETDLVKFLGASPALVSSAPSRNAQSARYGQQSNLNLRGLGTGRTLVLVNGRRHVAGNTSSAAVDINSIPVDLIERIDIVTGGASAVYGADAVSGVVNFILKRNYEGVTASAQVGQASRGDGQQKLFSVLAGHNFAGGRGNITTSLEYSDYSPLFAEDRRYRSQAHLPETMLNAADNPDDPNIPDYVALPDSRVNDGALSGGFDTGSFDDNGVYLPGVFDGRADFTGAGDVFNHGTNDRGYLTSGGSGTPNTSSYTSQLMAAEKRALLNVLGSFEVSPALRLFAEGKFSHQKSLTDFYLTYDLGTFISPENPYIPASIRSSIDPDQGFYLIERDNRDLGMPRVKAVPRTIRGVLGGDGRLTDWLTYEASYSYGETRLRTDTLNDRYSDRSQASLDVIADPLSGEPVCRSNVFPDTFSWDGRTTFTPGANSGCLPFNMFGENVTSDAAKQWLLFTSRISQKVSQRVGNATFKGNMDPLFKTAGGSVDYAFGVEYRRESISFDPDADVRDGLGFADFGSGQQPQSGSFNVKELFAEVNIPLLSERRFVDELSLGLAGRYSDYSTSGGDTTWNINLVYGPIPGLRFRGALSRAVRAPNLIEAFAAPSVSREFVDDPCDVTNVNNGSSYRADNCEALLSSVGVDPATFRPNETNSGIPVSATTRGNSSVNPESAKVWTAGVLFDNLGVRGLSASIDWYDVDLTGAIDTLNPLALCVDAPSIDNEYCAAIQRDSSGATAGYVRTYVVQPTNVASFKTSGLDLTLNYGFKTGQAGDWNFHLVGGYLKDLSFSSLPGADPVQSAGQVNSPKKVIDADVTWTLGSWAFNYGVSWWSSTYNVDYVTLAAEPDYYESRYLKTGSIWKHDVQATFNYDDRVSVFATINNVTDEKPFFRNIDYLVDTVGRYFSIGAKVRL